MLATTRREILGFFDELTNTVSGCEAVFLFSLEQIRGRCLHHSQLLTLT